MIACYRDRARTLRQALADHAPQLDPAVSLGGSALWVTGPKGLDTRELARRLYDQGVVVESGDVFYPVSPRPVTQMRIGYSSISADRIELGVKVIARELTQLLGAR